MQHQLQAFFKKSEIPANGGPFLFNNRHTLILAIAIFLLALFFRSWQNLLNPGLYHEDAGHYFNFYYGIDRDISSILQNPNGYYNIFNNFIAWLTQHFDVRMQPGIYLVSASVMGCITASIFAFTGLVRNRLLLLLSPLVLGLSGMNHIFYYNTLTFQMYNVVVILLCLLFFPPNPSRFFLFAYIFSAFLLVWSGPYSVVALPVTLLFLLFFHNREKTILIIYTIIILLFYTFSVKSGTIMLSNIFDEEILLIAYKTLFERVFFFDLFGATSSIKVGSLLLVIFSIFYYLKENAFFIKISIIFFTIIVAALAPLFLSIKYLLYQDVLLCHIYVSQFFWLCFILFSADQIIQKTQPNYFTQIFIAMVFCSFVLFDNIRHPEKGKIDLMPAIPEFVDTIHLIEQLELEKKNQYVYLLTDNIVPGYLDPCVRVGSYQDDAKRLSSNEIPIPSGHHFIVDDL